MINGDDFGMTESCTKAICLALKKGLITHTTMIANGACFETAVTLAKEQGIIDKIGWHIDLTEGKPLTAAIARCPLFVRGGSFHKDYLKAPVPLGAAEQAAVLAELTAQAQRLRDSGIPFRHADSHHYIHTYLYIAPLVAQVCRRFGVEQIRLNRTFAPTVTEGRIDNGFWREQGFLTTKRFGRMSDFPDGAYPGDTEVLVHPDFDRDGVLIDRRGTENGVPFGERLAELRERRF